MKKRKIPRDLLHRVQRIAPEMRKFETMERYVLKTLLEAGRCNTPIDEMFITAGHRILMPQATAGNIISAA